MKTTSTMPATADILRMPQSLAAECTIGGLNPSSLRLALVLATMGFYGEHGAWTINKRDLELRTHVVLDNAERLIAPLRQAMLEKDDIVVPLFDSVEYEPGTRWKTAGMISVRLNFMAREMLFSQQKTVLLPIDELRAYSSLSGIMLRMRLAARMQAMKSSKLDEWRLGPEDFEKAGVFGSYAMSAQIRRSNAKGEIVEYVSLSRAADLLLKKGVAEINTRSTGVELTMIPIKMGDDANSRWKAIQLVTKRLSTGKPAKKTMADLNKRSKQPALAAR